MTAAYLVTAQVAGLGLVVWLRPRVAAAFRAPRSFLSNLLGLCLLGAAAVLSSVLPVFRFPNPTGRYRVGTTSLRMVDESRTEPNSTNPREHRELMVQIWYPAGDPPPGLQPERYLANLDGPNARELIRREFGPLFGQLNRVRSHSYGNLSVSPNGGPFPIVIFSPSWGGSRNQDTALVEDLASHGFVVAGIDHTHGAGITVFPDGRVVFSNPDLTMDTSTAAGVQRFLRQTDEQGDIRARDASFVLDELGRMNAGGWPGLLSGHLDLARAGILGYSFGGVVALRACQRDPRFKAGINLDGLLYRESDRARLNQPFMIFNSDDSPPSAAEMARSPAQKMSGDGFRIQDDFLKLNGGYNLTVQGANHPNFCDSPLFSPLRRLTGGGSINPRRCFRIVSEYTRAFFEKHLEGRPTPLLDGQSPEFLDVKVEIFHRGLSTAEHPAGPR